MPKAGPTLTHERVGWADPLVVIAVVVAISLVVAGVLFGILDSTGVVENKYAKFGGAAAGFFATLVLLQRWHDKLASAATDDVRELRERLAKAADPPNFRIPDHFLPYVAAEESLAFCYPQSWRQEPQRFDLIFVQRPEQMRPGDSFRGNLNVVVLPTSQRVPTLGMVCAFAEHRGIARSEVTRRVGIELTPATEGQPIPLNQTLAILGIDGPEFADQLYDLEALGAEILIGRENITRDTTYVDGIRSMSLLWSVDRDGVRLVQHQTTTYVARLDVSYIMTFTDDDTDRESIKQIAQEVLDTVRFWTPE